MGIIKFLIITVIGLGISVGVAMQGRVPARWAIGPTDNINDCNPTAPIWNTASGGYSCEVWKDATPVWETVAIAIGLFVGTIFIGALIVWISRILLGGLQQAVANTVPNLGDTTYNDNRSINIVNIEGRRYIIKDDKAIPIDE